MLDVKSSLIFLLLMYAIDPLFGCSTDPPGKNNIYFCLTLRENIISFVPRNSNMMLFLILVDGGWGDWTEWKECAVSCGGADQGRFRVCDNPTPQFGGDDCTIDGSSASEKQRCNENPCPSRCYFSISYYSMTEQFNVFSQELVGKIRA